jgi:xanthine dehydrogenase YagT iron-sulfur-binding subunit
MSQPVKTMEADKIVGPTPVRIQMRVNGQWRNADVPPQTTLVDAIRDHLDLLGTKVGCAHGQCGACTVLINGNRRHSCLILAIMHDGDEVQTIEGVSSADELHPLQKAFIEHDAFQCGFCTPGQIMSGLGLLQEGHARTAQDVREQMSGNLCRCAAYQNIVAAILEVQQKSKKASQTTPLLQEVHS